MKPLWQICELSEHFTLLPTDLALLANKTGPTRLGFAILLKFFQYEARFPYTKNEVPWLVVSFVAQQLKLSPELYLQYDWRGHSVVEHRTQIRFASGFREIRKQDQEECHAWLVAQVLPTTQDLSQLKQQVLQRFREQRIEPPSPKQLERLVRSALKTYETALFQTLQQKLSATCQANLDELLYAIVVKPESVDAANLPNQEKKLWWLDLKADPGPPGLESLSQEAAKLKRLRQLKLPPDLFQGLPPKMLQRYRVRAVAEQLYELRRHPEPIRHSLVAAFCHCRQREITDSLVELICEIAHKIGTKAEKRTTKELLQQWRGVHGKTNLLYQLAEAAVEHPDGVIKETIFPVVGETKLKALVEEYKLTNGEYRAQVQAKMRETYRYHYRRMLPIFLEVLEFRASSSSAKPLLAALNLLRRYSTVESKQLYYPATEKVPLEGVVKPSQQVALWGSEQGQPVAVVERLGYELRVLEVLREKLRTKEVWVVGAWRYRNPDEDLPTDFEAKKAQYFATLNQPLSATTFTSQLQAELQQSLETLDQGLPDNDKVKISGKQGGWITLTPLEAQAEPTNLSLLKAEVGRRWPMTGLLEVLKETALRTGFLEDFRSATVTEKLPTETLHKRLLLTLYGLGTNTGLKRMSCGDHGENYKDLLYVRHRYLLKDHLKQAIIRVANATFESRVSTIWGEATTSCASDSTQFRAYDQNLLSQWHPRYGKPGVMVYWHVEKKAVCVHSLLKTCNSSEAAAMLEGVLRHCTSLEIDRQFVDTHGQSEIAFGLSHLLGFELMPRFKNIYAQKLYVADSAEEYPNLKPILLRPINWALIEAQYEELVKYASALLSGTVEAEVLLRRFSHDNAQHPVYQALAELGRAVKSRFLCRYLHAENLRREIQEGLNVIENWNGANDFIFFGKGGELTSNRREDQEISMLALHLLQISLVFINTLMLQNVLSEQEWLTRLKPEDFRGLTPLFYAHINPYGSFRLNLSERLPLDMIGKVVVG